MAGRPWTKDEDAYLQRHYPHMVTWAVAIRLQRSESAVYGRANLLGLSKTAKFLRSDWVRNPAGRSLSPQTQFQKGHVPHNKGKKGWRSGGKSTETQFPKGHKPHNWVPVGSERLSNEGILQRKITDTGYPPRDWKSVHSLLWEKYNGPIPPGHIVAFRNRDRRDIRIENLELINRAENMRRNTINNLPSELADVCRIRGVLNRHINNRIREKNRDEKQD